MELTPRLLGRAKLFLADYCAMGRWWSGVLLLTAVTMVEAAPFV
jgi:hypothetical protein